MLPEINTTSDSTTYQTAFAGVNLNLNVNDGEFADMVNITNDSYPVLTNRPSRGFVRSITKAQAMIGGQYLAYVSDNDLYYNHVKIKELEETDAERQLVIMGAYLVVFPDGYIYNTYDGTESTVENEFKTSDYDGYTLTFQMCKLNGTKYDSTNTVVSSTEPSDTSKYWLDTSDEDSVVLKMYSTSTSMWTSVGTTYVKVTLEKDGTYAPIGTGFSAYDGLKFSGITITGYNDQDFNTTNLIYACDTDYLIIAGFINIVGTQTTEATFKREMPEMDFVVELNNRIWGCSSTNHEIYACKQGDPKNWNCFAGLDSDSYAATVGSQNEFTGIASYGGYVFFFKENGFHRMYGTKPSNYEIQWKEGVGVQKGSSKSVCVVSDTLIFKAKDDFYQYDGTFYKISDNLGIQPYYDATAGYYRSKYYVCMRDADYNWKLYVYDTTKKTWVIEDVKRFTYMAFTDDGMYILGNDGKLYVVNKEAIYTVIFPQMTTIDEKYSYPGDWYPGKLSDGSLEEVVNWDFETGDIIMETPYRKYVKRVNVRIWLDSNAKMKIEIMYDSSDEWSNVCEFYSTRKRSYELHAPIKRCDHFRLRFSGYGDMRLYSISQVSDQGSGVDE